MSPNIKPIDTSSRTILKGRFPKLAHAVAYANEVKQEDQIFSIKPTDIIISQDGKYADPVPPFMVELSTRP